jgi:hypothetical protein
VITELLVGLKNAPSKQCSHVQGTNPGLFKDVIRQIKAEFRPRQSLRLRDEIRFMLQNRDLFEHRNDSIKPAFHLMFVRLKLIVELLIR